MRKKDQILNYLLGITTETYRKQLTEIFEKKFDLDFNLPLVFLDTHFNKTNPEEKQAFDREAAKLWRVTRDKKPFQCLTR